MVAGNQPRTFQSWVSCVYHKTTTKIRYFHCNQLCSLKRILPSDVSRLAWWLPTSKLKTLIWNPCVLGRLAFLATYLLWTCYWLRYLTCAWSIMLPWDKREAFHKFKTSTFLLKKISKHFFKNPFFQAHFFSFLFSGPTKSKKMWCWKM